MTSRFFGSSIASIFGLCLACTMPGAVALADDLFPDKNLEAAVRKEVFEKRYNSEPITTDDVKNISQVIGKGKGIKSLEGLQHCKALMKLDLENNEIADLNPIRDLKQLQSIDLASNKISSIEPLAGLTGIQYLQLSNNGIEDIAPLSEMKNLQSLYMAGNKIKKLEPLSKHKKLWTLDIAGSPVENFAVISELKGLQTLNVKGCSVKSLDFVKPLTELKLLILNDNKETDLAPLVDSCENDAKSERRFAPYLRLYLDDATLKDANRAPLLDRLRTIGVRINPSLK